MYVECIVRCQQWVPQYWCGVYLLVSQTNAMKQYKYDEADDW
jgi:hypothetical protein